MTRTEQSDWDGTLVEPQGVNAGPAIDAEAVPGPDEETAGAERVAPPETHMPTGAISEEMAGLPAELPGYPGQQRSVDTS